MSLTVPKYVGFIRVSRVLLRSSRLQVGNLKIDKWFPEVTPLKAPDAGRLVCRIYQPSGQPVAMTGTGYSHLDHETNLLNTRGRNG